MKDEITKISWNCLEEKVFLDFPYIQIVERQCKRTAAPAEEEAHRFYVFRSRDWCNIMPITEDGKIVLIRQFRAGTLQPALEFPGGVVESADSDVQATALREMVEETGYEPVAGAKCVLLGTSHPNPALQDNRVHSLIVGPVKKSKLQNLDPAEDIEVLEVPLNELPQILSNGRFSHALMLTSLFHLLWKIPEVQNQMKKALQEFTHAP